MNRRGWLTACLAAVAARSIPAHSQSARRVPRIGLLWIESDRESRFASALRDGLSARGYIDGRTIAIDAASLVDRYDRLPKAAERLVDEKVDVIVSYGAT